MGLGLAAQVSSEDLSFGQSVEDGLLDAVGVVVQAHVTQHHDGREKEGSGVGKALSSNIRGGTVDSFEDGALVTNVARGSETETTDKTSAHIGENVTVQVGHDKDLVVIRIGVGNHLQAGVVEKLRVELDLGEILGDIMGNVQEETVGHLHDGSLVDNANLLATDSFSMLERESEHTLRSLPCDELDGLNDTVNNNVLNAGVLALSVFSDQNGIDVIVGSLVASNGTAGSQVCEEVECAAEGKVEGDMALANGSLLGLANGGLKIRNC